MGRSDWCIIMAIGAGGMMASAATTFIGYLATAGVSALLCVGSAAAVCYLDAREDRHRSLSR
jgi:dihydrodipicolinate synthase/N-acetylneuraminate lyase